MTRNVVVTGGLGRAGRWVLGRLVDRCNLLCIDQHHPGEDPRIDFKVADLTAGGETHDLISEADPDTVIHLAAYASALHHPESTVFRNNVESAYNVLEAAGRNGADVIWASTTGIYDRVYDPETWPPDRLPITEAYPTAGDSAYPASKIAGEAVAEMVHRRYGRAVVTLRPTLLVAPDEPRTREKREEFDAETSPPTGNFLSYVDVRDLASLIEAVLDSDLGDHGHQAYNVSARDNYLDRNTVSVLETVFGSVPEECDLSGDDAILSTEKARETFDWTQAYTWRETEGDDTTAPTFGEE